MNPNSENMDKILKIVNSLIQFYSENSDLDMKEFKNLLEEYLRNPISGNWQAFELNKILGDLTSEKTNFQSLWQEIEQHINENYPQEMAESRNVLKKKLREYEKKLIDLIVEFGKSKGTVESLSKIIGYLLIHKKLTQAKLQKLSGLSRGTISEHLKMLVDNGYVDRTVRSTPRTYQYSLGNDMKALSENTSMIKIIKSKEIETFSNKKLSELNQIESKSNEGALFLKERLKELREYSRMYKMITQQIRDSANLKNFEGFAK